MAKLYFKNTAILNNILAAIDAFDQKLSAAKVASEQGIYDETLQNHSLLKEPLQELDDLPQFEQILQNKDSFDQIVSHILNQYLIKKLCVLR